ncbi:glycosyl hydrolases family 31-domain-containing protein [Aspergillus granulosus]|uniref:alpha-glucosidase n=1 Tax=Aspergillus granulosus TaxID=176169 RepID=A0ABR4GSA7_9EURO
MAHRYNFAQAPVANPGAIVGGIEGSKYRFTVLADGLLRYEYASDGQFEDRASVLAVNRQLLVPKFRAKETPTSLEIITRCFHLTYDKKAFSPSGLSAAVKGNYWAHSSVWYYGDKNETLGGTARTLDDANGRVEMGHGIVSRKGFASIDDSKSMLFDEKGWLATRREGDRVDGYLFAYGHDYRGAVKALYTLSGPQPLLPRWALGNWWSRYHAYDEAEFLELMDNFKSRRIPLSVAVLDMDWHIVDDPRIAEAGVTGWTGYTWNKQLFPDPEAFLKKLHDYGLKTSLNVHPADGIHSFEDLYQEVAAKLGHDTSQKDPVLFDITNQAFLDAYFDVLHRRLESEGVDLWWVDWQQGQHSRIPGIDPLWVLNHFHFLDSAYDAKRPLTFSRYAGPGSHRYPIGFSGDTHITWKSLAFQPEFTNTASNIGYGWWSHDIGGHFHGAKDDELLIRWVQYGTFSPILRLHSSNSPWNPKEPWNLGGDNERVLTKFLRLRHRLVPYLYSMNARAARQSLPITQPMYWEYPEHDEAYQVPNQYLFGSELMVAPITSPRDRESGLGQVLVWFPPARHVDIFSGVVYDGNRLLWVARPLDSYPVFAREGSIIPFDGDAEPSNGCKDPDVIELVVVVGADGSFDLLEDEGTGASVNDIEFSLTSITFSQADGKLTIRPRKGTSSPRTHRAWNVRFPGFSSTKDIHFLVNDTPQDVHLEGDAAGLIVRLDSRSVEDELVLSVGENPQLDIVSQNPRFMTFFQQFLQQAQMSLDLKDTIWKTVSKEVPAAVKAGELVALGLREEILNALLEVLLAAA